MKNDRCKLTLSDSRCCSRLSAVPTMTVACTVATLNAMRLPVGTRPVQSPEPFGATIVPQPHTEDPVNEETFNISIRKFLKMVGVNSQRQIEQAVERAIADGSIAGTETFPAKVTLEAAGLKLNVAFDGEIKLE